MTGATTLYEQSAFPIFQNRMYDSADEARSCPRGDIRLVQDDISGLVYNADFQPELMNYDAAYQNEQAHSPMFKSHLEQVATIVERYLGTEALVEVGCGKAYFLELLQSRGCSIAGFDPTYEGENLAVQRRYFGDGVTVSGRGLILRHVLEHVQNPVGFLDGLRDANGGGLIYIEVPCFDWILRARAWFDIFYEHVNYFRLGDFSTMFGHVVDGGHLFGANTSMSLPISLPCGHPCPVRRPVSTSRRIFWRRYPSLLPTGRKEREPYGVRRRKASSTRCCGNAAATRWMS